MNTVKKVDTGYNPWRTAMISLGVSISVLVVAGLVVAAIYEGPDAELKQSESDLMSDRIIGDDNRTHILQLDRANQSPAIDRNGPQAGEPVSNSGRAGADSVPYQPPIRREDCSRYLLDAEKDSGKVLRDGLAGGALGAGLGAAGGAIADGGDGAGKGAAIGGMIGAVAGALNRNTKENQKSQSARLAYENCLARNDY